MKKILLSALFFVCLQLLATSLASAQVNRSDIAVLNGGRTTVLLKAPSSIFAPAKQPSAGLVTIYSNLGTGTNVYNGGAGSGVLGRNVPGMPFPEWLGNAFVPTADHTITEVQVGVTYVSGPNTVILSLNADNGGVPGNVLRTWTFTNLTTFGTCCTLQTAMLNTPLAVTKGTTYWVVLRTLPSNQGTWDVWNDNFKGTQGTFSNNIGSGWVQGGIQTQGAFGVFGQ